MDAHNNETPLSTKATAAFGIMGMRPGARLFRSALPTVQPKRTRPPTSIDRRPATGGRGWTKSERSAFIGNTSEGGREYEGVDQSMISTFFPVDWARFKQS